MRKLLIAFPAAVLILVSFSIWGCSADDEELVAVPSVPCSLELTTFFAGDRFLPGAPDSQTVKIRWEKEGSAPMVNVDLLKGGNLIERVVSGAVNSGYYSWRANNHGADDGSDFSLVVSADGETGCSSTTDEFVLLNTIGCTLDFSNDFPDSLHVGDTLNLTWDSEDMPGLVTIYLTVRGDDVGVIATDISPEEGFDWTVDTYGYGTYDRFVIFIRDSKIPDYCNDSSRYFKIQDAK